MLLSGTGKTVFEPVHADDTSVGPVTPGIPTLAEIESFASANSLTNTFIYYTGDDNPASPLVELYLVDSSGTATTLEKSNYTQISDTDSDSFLRVQDGVTDTDVLEGQLNGFTSIIVSSVDSTVLLGYGAATSGLNQVSIGAFAFASGSAGSGHVSIGSGAGQNASIASIGVLIGRNAGQNITGTSTVAIGDLAAQNAVDVRGVFIGEESGRNSDAQFLVSLGYRAGRNAVFAGNTGSVLIGSFAGTNATGRANVAIGHDAFADAADADDCIALGALTGQFMEADDNIGIGSTSSRWVKTAQNIGIGVGTNNELDGGINNLSIGHLTGRKIVGGNNTFIGDHAGDLTVGSGNIKIATGSDIFNPDLVFNVTDADFTPGQPGASNLNIPGHGLGVAGNKFIARFQGAAPPNNNTNPLMWEVVDANNVTVAFQGFFSNSGTGSFTFETQATTDDNIFIGSGNAITSDNISIGRGNAGDLQTPFNIIIGTNNLQHATGSPGGSNIVIAPNTALEEVDGGQNIVLGAFAGRFLVGEFNVLIGYENTDNGFMGDNCTIIGRGAQSVFTPGPTFAVVPGDINVTNDTLTIPGHGLGPAGARVIARFNGSGLPSVGTNDFTWEVVDANTLRIANGRNITNAGTGPYNFEVSETFAGSTAIGFNAAITDNNQLVLGGGGLQSIKSDATTVSFGQFPSYVDDAAADADTSLPSGGLYKLNGSRAVYQKP